MIDASEAALLGAMAFFAAIVGGLAGYGTGLLMPIVLVPVVGAEATVPILAVAGLFNNATRMAVFRNRVEWHRVWPIAAVAVPACLVGAGLYTVLSGPQAALLIGTTLIATVPGRRMLGQRRLAVGLRGSLGLGAVYGLITGGTPGAGVVLITTLLAIGLGGTAVVATDAAISLIVGIAKVAAFQALGELPASSWLLAIMIGLIGIPGVFVARWLGTRMSVRLHGAVLDGAVVVGGCFLVLRGLGTI